jgi:glycosyltransferase involved in cell wall biosynthesis
VSIYFRCTPHFSKWRLVTTVLSHRYWGLLRSRIPLSWRIRVRRLLTVSAHRDFRFNRGLGWDAGSAQVTRTSPRCIQVHAKSGAHGIDLHGYLSRWLGLGECARLYARALLESGFPVSLHDVDIDIPHARNDRTLAEHFRPSSQFRRDLIFVNPDHWDDALEKIYRDGNRRDRYVIGYWFWELERFPAAWLPMLDRVDEIMVSSGFVERALRGVTDKPITRVPLPVVPGEDSGLKRHHFDLDEHSYVYFCSFDFNSSIARKNPFAVIKAFCLAFPRGDEKVSLLIKSFNGHRDVVLLMRLAAAAGSDHRIILRDDMLERADLQALHRCVDVHVSLHRSEGFGLGMAEAMCMGKPVVATSYSGNMEYMTPDNSCLVDFDLVPVREGEYQHGDGQYWAEPDPAHAAQHMRKLYEDRAFGARIGARASADMQKRFSVDACMAVLARRFGQLDDSYRTPVVGFRAG